MKSNILTPRFIFLTSIILLAAVCRLLSPIPNFTPVAAMALFGGAYFTDKRMAVLIPLITMFLSDVVLELFTPWGFHDTMIYVYIGFVLTSIIGMFVGRKTTVLSIAGGALASSVLFFIITNFGVWAASGFQGGLTGLNVTYLLGIPFFTPTLIGDLFYSAVLFGAFYLAQVRYPALIRVK